MTTTVTPIHVTLWDWLCAIFFWIPAWVWFALTLRHELREERALMVRPVEGPPTPPTPPTPATGERHQEPEEGLEPATNFTTNFTANFTAEVMGAIALADVTAKLASQEPAKAEELVAVRVVCPFCEAAQLERRADGRSVLRIPGTVTPVKVCAHHRRARRLARDRATLAGEFVMKPYVVEPPSRASLN